uniref:Uncharacterized protein n=1 Tax=Anguilla anguilla TaxID=7936 RepID=A0A0E9UXK4_ANGAN
MPLSEWKQRNVLCE